MAKSLDTSDSNNILKTLFIIIIVIGIAYFIYHLYTQNTVKSRGPSEHQISEEQHIAQKRRMMMVQDEENRRNMNKMNSGSADIRSTMKGSPQGMGDPIMQKREMNPNQDGGVIGSSNMEFFSQDPSYKKDRNATSFPKDQLSADELLPQDNSSLWAQVNPSGEGSLKDRNFLQSGYHIGINTVGQTLRNANLQLRSEPPCPQVKVSPWLQSTIESDLGRKPFEIGGCA